MDHISIPIPDGIDDAQKADLTGWLTALAEQATATHHPLENDPHFRSELTAKARQGMAEIAAGQGMDARQSMREIADEFGINLKR